jgi:hypothetical protein
MSGRWGRLALDAAQTTKELVDLWKQYVKSGGDPKIIHAIEVELHNRPVRERIAAGYPK